MFGQMSRGDAAVGAMRVAFDRFREWPARSTRALQDGTFKVPHARLVQVSCSLFGGSGYGSGGSNALRSGLVALVK